MQTIKDDISKGGKLIDVRTATEYESGHIDGAVNLSLQDIQAGTLPTAPKDKPVYVYCRSGNRSSQASATLKAAGYQNIIDLGTITHVQSIGGEIKT
jgi:rhodanese-related sulfurtransferase